MSRQGSGSLLDQWARDAESAAALPPVSDQDRLDMQVGRGARLNRDEMEAQKRSGAARRDVPLKAFVDLVPVFRLYHRQTGAHYLTTSEAERDQILATQPQYVDEGPVFQAGVAPQAGLLPVHRFLNSATGAYLYTISESERSYLQANLPAYAYQGVAFYASAQPGPELRPVYRFYRQDRRTHLFTIHAAERDSIIQSLCAFRYQGAAFYVPDASFAGEPSVATPNAVVLVIGDSLSQGYGVSMGGRQYGFVTPGRVWTERLASEIRSRTGKACNQLINVSIGGMRTDHGLERIRGWLDQHAPTHVILAQGTNDAWQNRGAWSIENNLSLMAQASAAAQAQVLVMDFAFYPRGTAYRQGLTELYQRVATNHSGVYFAGSGGIPLNATYYHPDEVHLKDAAQPLILENTWRALEPTF